MRVIYKNHAATIYGEKSLSITNEVGKEVFHTDDRTANTEEELKAFLKDYVNGLDTPVDFCESCQIPPQSED